MDKHVVILEKFLDVRVCSAGTWDEALQWLRENSPSGTENNWQKNEALNFEPVKCDKDATRTHYMFVC